ncbi:MAG: hypothetical protein JOZ78_27420 [Chroococcidiopsidaceae cyanobacterium CP_BM_ER_R8_30]|nr:hypothetical protein [Chroococcidiopsidaceae cyanobacterium CP_BM_ER_R8_30]
MLKQSFWQINKLVGTTVSLLILKFCGVNIVHARLPLPSALALTAPTTFIVNSTSDNPNPSTGVMTLRKAISLANKITGPVLIKFDLGENPQTITLTQGNIDITNPNSQITIDGSNNTVTVSCNKNSGVFSISSSAWVNIQQLNMVGCE